MYVRVIYALEVNTRPTALSYSRNSSFWKYDISEIIAKSGNSEKF